MQGTMKAARIYGFEKTSKSTDLLRVDEVPIPDIESGEVLIRVLRAGLNHGAKMLYSTLRKCRPYRFCR
jgi:NADPH:quinone reductase-like Zn-dependent oxidoreductase